MNSKIHLLILLVVVFTASCGSKKKSGEIALKINSNNYQEVLNKRNIDWEFMSIQADVDYKTDPKLPKLNAFLRMEKGKHIWLSVRVPVLGEISRILIREDSIHALMKLPKKEYYVLPTTMLQKYIPGVSGLDEVQNLLLNQPPFKKDQYQWKETNLDSFLLAFTNPQLTNQLGGKRKIGRINTCEINTTDGKYKAQVQYSNPQKTDKQSLPYNLEIKGKTSKQDVHILIKYKKVEKEEVLTFPFKVGESYERK